MVASESASLTVGIPCRADEPSLDLTLESLLTACRHPDLPADLRTEIMICINGLKANEECCPLTAARQVAARHAIPLREYVSVGCRPPRDGATLTRDFSPLSLTILRTGRLGKAVAWNIIRRWAASDVIVFCDADVQVRTEAILFLYEKLQANPSLRLVASKQVPVVASEDGWLRRAAALPYRFYFHNVTGGLYIMRRDAIVGDMPERLLFEDAWLTLAVGRQWIAQEPRAQVFFLPPATLHDWLAERVRTEAGKLQIQRDYPELLTPGPAAAYPWRAFLRGIRCKELPLVFLLLSIRLCARIRARRALRAGQGDSLWRVVQSSKQWEKTV